MDISRNANIPKSTVSQINILAVAVPGKLMQNEGIGSHFKGEKERKTSEESDIAWIILLTILVITLGLRNFKLEIYLAFALIGPMSLVRIIKRASLWLDMVPRDKAINRRRQLLILDQLRKYVTKMVPGNR